MRIEKTTLPEDILSQNEWFETFNVSSRLDKFQGCTRSKDINSQYNFANFKLRSTKKSYFFNIIKYLKFGNI